MNRSSDVFATAGEIAAAVRDKKVSIADVVQTTFDRIDRHNPVLNAIVWEDRGRAMARAREMDAALARHDPPGPLAGVPVTIKESFAYQGSPSTWGIPTLKDALSPRTAVAVERLEAAGAIVVGKTNVPMRLGDWQSYNAVYGTSNNPWDVTRTPGGSTGGGAAAVAAGLGALALGTDLNGSLRIPAHFCGVYGHKPSLALVSLNGMQPGPWDGTPSFASDISAAGPLARSARDLALALDALGGPNGTESKAWSWRMPPPRHSRVDRFRVGYTFDDPMVPVVPEVKALYERMIQEVEKAGATLDPGWPAGIDLRAHVPTFQYLMFAFLTADADPSARARARERLEQNPNDAFAAAMTEPHARWLRETQNRLVFRGRWEEYFEHHDVFLMPPTITTAIAHDHSEPMDRRMIQTPGGPRRYIPDLAAWVSAASLAGLPATVAPIGRTAEGLPVGVQIVGPMWEDGTPIEFAALLADLVGGFTPPPAL
jgi:amidase